MRFSLICAQNCVEHTGSTGNANYSSKIAVFAPSIDSRVRFEQGRLRLQPKQRRSRAVRIADEAPFGIERRLKRITTFEPTEPIGNSFAFETDRTLFRFSNALLVRSSVSIRSDTPLRHLQFRIERRHRKTRTGASQWIEPQSFTSIAISCFGKGCAASSMARRSM